ncbi:TetR/AcrR family transcriptional regulator [Nonomuraea sp. NPDC049152]|uniref:TetR/AcrR family transcriptional regulator n=1 Tax=Nonomuraea sp. NPDC049152 TaxID=3154350 RepID=UPI0033FFD56B
MGKNREDLLAGAKRCLIEKGYTRTTARDIANAAGVSLAAIGYHFGSKETLLNEALFESMKEWGDSLEAALTGETDQDATPMERFETVWRRVMDTFEELRPLWVTQFEIVGQIDHLPEMREHLAAGLQAARFGLAEVFSQIDPAAEPERARVLGSFYQAMLSGLLMQWLVDPASAPTARDVTEAMSLISRGT